MKTAAIPAVRVSPELRQTMEEMLRAGETLSGFVEESVRRNVEFRRAQQAFIGRGLASGEAAKASGRYVSSEEMLAKLALRLEQARQVREPAP
jgi:predicted transcriptional regulator